MAPPLSQSSSQPLYLGKNLHPFWLKPLPLGSVGSSQSSLCVALQLWCGISGPQLWDRRSPLSHWLVASFISYCSSNGSTLPPSQDEVKGDQPGSQAWDCPSCFGALALTAFLMFNHTYIRVCANNFCMKEVTQNYCLVFWHSDHTPKTDI